MAMYFLAKKLTDKDASEIQRMIPRRDFVEKWKHLEREAHDLAKKLTGKEANTNSGAWKILSAAAPENILFLSMTTRQSAVDQKIKNFMTKWRQVREKLPFPEMAELRITPQLPEYAEILDKAFLLLMDGKLRSHNEIMNFLRPYEPPPPPPPPPARRGRGKAVVVEAAHVAAPVVVATPGKRGRKPKAGVAPVSVAVTPPAPVEAAKPSAKPAVAAKPTPEVKKAAPAKPTKKAEKPAKKAAPAMAKPAQKKAPAKKPVPKKPSPKKPVSKKPTAKKAAKKKR
jgi:tRNA nucleotidyltransferase (CCA-adding enzyme)